MIEVKKVSRSFGSIKAVENLSFNVKEGEILGLLGPNGAGKTTTMRIITGFITPDKGDVLIDKLSVSQNPTKIQSLIGYLPENNPLYKEMLVKEFLEISAELKGLRGEEKKDALDFSIKAMNIADVYYRPIGELSKGYKQRVGLAATLLSKPKILILDEPTSGLDPNQTSEIRKLIKELAKSHTIILSTHIMQEVEAVCSSLVIINNGKLVVNGSVEEVSKGKKGEKTTLLEIEGKGAKSALENLESVKSVAVTYPYTKNKNRIRAKVITDNKVSIQPEISRLASKNNWIIWRIEEEKQDLEVLFR